MRLLNIEERQKPMLIGKLISSIAYGMTGPVLRAKMMADLGTTEFLSKFFALENLIACLAGVFIPLVWNKVQSKLIKHYTHLEIFESFVITGFWLFMLLHWNPILYMFADVIWYALFTSLLFKCADTCYNYLFPTPKSKTNANSNAQLVANAGSILGLVLGIVLPSVDWRAAILTFCACDIIRSVTQVYTYSKYRSYLKPIFEEEKQAVGVEVASA